MSKDFFIVIKKLDNHFKRFLITSYIVHGNKKIDMRKSLKDMKKINL